MEQRSLKRIRDLGLTEQTSSGREGVRVTAQFRQPLEGQPDERRRALEEWTGDVARKLAKHGGEVVPDSLSILGQTVEAIVPLDAVESAEAEIAGENARLDLVMPRQIF